MKTRFTLLSILTMTLILIACDPPNKAANDTDRADGTLGLNIPAGFTFQTTKSVDLKLDGTGIQSDRVLVEVYNNNPMNGGVAVHRTFVQADSEARASVNLPSFVSDVWLIISDSDGKQHTQKVSVANGAANIMVADAEAGTASAVAQCSIAGYTTYTMGGWGSPPNSTPGGIRHDNFDTVFPDGLVVGHNPTTGGSNGNGGNSGSTTGYYSITLTSADAVEAFLPSGGSVVQLSADHTDPTSALGNLAGQLTAAMMNVEFDRAGHLGTAPTPIGELVYKTGPFEGWTVDEFLAMANEVLGGGLTPPFITLENIKDGAEWINLGIEGDRFECPEDEPVVDNARVSPILECVSTLGGGVYRAEFSWETHNTTNVAIPVGNDNRFVGGGSSAQDRGQTTVFEFPAPNHPDDREGRAGFYPNNVFSVDFDGSPLTWSLKGPDGSTRTATASSGSLDCATKDDPPLTSIPYPGEDVFGTLAYEDLWPSYGDFDMNDLVLDYNIIERVNVANNVEEIEFTFVIRALGAMLDSGFGIELPVNHSYVASVDGARYTTGLISNRANGTENGHDNAVIILWDESALNMGKFVNTLNPANHVDEDTLTVTVTFDTPVEQSALGAAPYNPFIYVDGDRGKEVHLPGKQPTALADPGFFGQYDDATEPGTSNTYVSKSNLFWAIHLPVSWTYPREYQDVTNAYNNFQAWAESGGVTNQDWYLDLPGYRNESLLYIKP